MFYEGLLYASDLAVHANFECWLSLPSHRLTIAIPLHWIWFKSWFTAKKLSRGRKKSETLLAVFGGLPVFEVLIQTSRAVFVFVNSPLEVKTYVLSAGYWMELEKNSCNTPRRRAPQFLEKLTPSWKNCLENIWSFWGETRSLSWHIVKNLLRSVKRSIMMTIVLLVGWFQFFRRNESGLRFAMRKIWRLRNVRSSTIDPLLQSKLSLLSPLLSTILRFPSIIEGLVWLWNSS